MSRFFETPSFVWFVLILGGLATLTVRRLYCTCSIKGILASSECLHPTALATILTGRVELYVACRFICKTGLRDEWPTLLIVRTERYSIVLSHRLQHLVMTR